jgi:hypothetical protein
LTDILSPVKRDSEKIGLSARNATITEGLVFSNIGSLNSERYNYASLNNKINRLITESQYRDPSGAMRPEIKMPITRENMKILCSAMNLRITPIKIIDAVLYCRGPKMEKAPPSNF